MKETLSVSEDTPAIRKEKARLEKAEKQKLKVEKKAEQRVAKEERRQSRKSDKESSKREQEEQEAQQKLRVAEEQRKRDALQAVSSRAASAAVRVHNPPSSVGIVDELSNYLAASSLSDVTQQLDQQFEQMLDSKRTNPAAPPGFAPLSTSALPASSLLLTSRDEAAAARIDFAKLDRAMPTASRQTEASEQKREQQHEAEEDEDYQRYSEQQAAHLVPDEGEYEQIAEKEEDGKEDTEVQGEQDTGGNWDDEPDDEVDNGSTALDAAQLDIAALNLRDVTEEEMVLAMVSEFESKQAAEHGLTHDVSAADMSGQLGTHLLDQEEQGPDGFDRRSAREMRRRARENETEEERRKRKDAKYKQRAQDAAEGVLDWDWSSDSDMSASGDEESGEEDEYDEEEDEEVEDVDGEVDAAEDDDEDEDEEDEEKDEDESAEEDESVEAKDGSSRAVVCTCFQPLSSHDPAIIAAQIDSFVASDVSSSSHFGTHACAVHSSATELPLVCSLTVPVCFCCTALSSQAPELSFPPFGVPLHRSNVHRIGQLFSLATSSSGEGTARFTLCSRTDDTEAADNDALRSTVAACTRQCQQLADKCPVHVLPLLAEAPMNEAEVRRLTAASADKRARKAQRDERLAAKREAKADKARQKLQKKLQKMKDGLRLKQKKGKHAWQNAAGEEERRGKREQKAAKRMVGMATSSAIPIPETNTGHQMLLALGWKGGGLGKKSDGRDQPIAAVVKLNSKGLGFVR